MNRICKAFLRASALIVSFLVIVLLAELGSVAAQKTGFTKHDLAYYMDAYSSAVIHPGLVLQIQSANIASDGTITVQFSLQDAVGLPLDLSGNDTAGAVQYRNKPVPRVRTCCDWERQC